MRAGAHQQAADQLVGPVERPPSAGRRGEYPRWSTTTPRYPARRAPRADAPIAPHIPGSDLAGVQDARPRGPVASASNVTAGVAIARRQTSSPNRLVSIDSLRLCGRHQSRSPLLAPSMQPGIAAVMPRRRAALLLSPVQANVPEFRRETLAPDEIRASCWAPGSLSHPTPKR
jgi:hypothetical protein